LWSWRIDFSAICGFPGFGKWRWLSGFDNGCSEMNDVVSSGIRVVSDELILFSGEDAEKCLAKSKAYLSGY
jgi:hypothetical protein